MAGIKIDRAVCGSYEENAYIVRPEGREGALIIDPGDCLALIEAALERYHVRPEVVALTHGHFDHMLSAAHLKNIYGARVCVSRADQASLADKTVNLMPPEATTPFLPMIPDEILEPGPWEACGMRFEILSTPGHTPGGVCFYMKDEGAIFTGDTLFSDGFGRTDMLGGSWPNLYHSLKTLFALPEGVFAWPGHGDGAKISDIRKVFYK